MKNGKIVQVMGPVIDVEFEDELPKIKDALEVELDGKKLSISAETVFAALCLPHLKVFARIWKLSIQATPLKSL